MKLTKTDQTAGKRDENTAVFKESNTPLSEMYMPNRYIINS